METLYDLVSFVLDSRDAYGDPANERRALRSAILGFEYVSTKHEWSEYHTEKIFEQQAAVELTCSVDTSGVVTVTAGTVPTWILEASLKVNSRTVPVDSQQDATTFTLRGYNGPAVGSDEFTLAHDRVVLDDEVKKIFSVRSNLNRIDLTFLTPGQFVEMAEQQQGNVSEPLYVTAVRGNSQGTRQTEIRFCPSPSAATTMTIAYYRHPRPAFLALNCGTVSSSGSTVTLSNPMKLRDSLRSPIGDLWLQVSTTATTPDADFSYTLGADTDIDSSHYVASITNRSTVELSTAPGAPIVNKGAMLTHTLDLPAHTYPAVTLFAEAEYARVGQGNTNDYALAMQLGHMRLLDALEQEGTLSRTAPAMLTRSAVYIRPEVISE